MLVGLLHISLHLPYAQGLKGRRKYLNSIKQRLKSKNLSVLDISAEYPKEAELAAAFVALSHADAHEKKRSVEELFDSLYTELECEVELELL